MTQLEIIEFYQFPNFDFRALVRSDKGNHFYYTQWSEYGELCTCVGFRVHGRCKHFEALRKEIEKRGKHITMNYNTFKSSIDAFNSIMGGIPKNTLINFYGMPKSAKSTIGTWTMLDTMRQLSSNALIIDTELGLADNYLPDIVERFNKLFGTDYGIKHMSIKYKDWLIGNQKGIVEYNVHKDDGKENQITVVDAHNQYELALLMGKPFEIDMSSRKPTVDLIHSDAFKYVWDSPLYKLLDDPNSEHYVNGVMLDSITVPMGEYGSKMQNFPPRHNAQQIILTSFQNILSFFHKNLDTDSVGIVTAHASKDPMANESEAKPVGGKAIGHTFKFSLQFSLEQRNDLNTIINTRAYRLPTQNYNNVEKVTVNDKGVF